MSIKVRTTDGEEEISVKFHEQHAVEDLKVEKKFHVKTDLQRLFYCGKQLEDGYILAHYNITFNDIILFMVKTQMDDVKNKVISDDEESAKNERASEQEKEDELEAKSLYYKIGDAIDCYYEKTGAWFEAIIKYIYKEGDEIFYKILWELDNAISSVPEAHIRPRARRSVPFNKLSVGQKVMINYNIDQPKKIGLWFDFTISEIQTNRRPQVLIGHLHINGNNKIIIRKRVKEEVYAIETPKLLTERTAEDELFMITKGKIRPVPPHCEECEDNPNLMCQSCSCNICACKEDTDTLLICDECNNMFHIKCLTPPLFEVPQETYWYCSECKNDENKIVKAGGKLKHTKKFRNKKKRNWGSGMACARRQEVRDEVPMFHSGPIPGVDVGTTWMFRMQVSEAGVHRPNVAGIHGREKDCAYSIVFSGGYKGDYDNGDEFLYSGSGGRYLSGNKRTNIQSKDQELTKGNLALAKNCNAPINDKDGATASEDNWKEGKPVRVVRNYKLAKFSKYAPEEGNRYDGIYKVVKYYPDKNVDGFVRWKYVLRRDDPIPAPWTQEGKERIAFLGLKMMNPMKGYSDTLKTFDEKKAKKRLAIGDKEDDVSIKKSKIKRINFDLEDELKVENEKVNAKLWAECTATVTDGKPAFLESVSEKFKCVYCLMVLYEPVVSPCGHNICLRCLERGFSSQINFCPICPYFLDRTYDIKINETSCALLFFIFILDYFIIYYIIIIIYLSYMGEE